MKKKLKIDLLATFQETEQIALMIAANNSGVNPVSLEDIASYLWARRYIGYILRADLHGKFEDDDKTKLFIMESGKCVATIEEIELHELNGSDDLNGLFTSEKQEETIL